MPSAEPGLPSDADLSLTVLLDELTELHARGQLSEAEAGSYRGLCALEARLIASA